MIEESCMKEIVSSVESRYVGGERIVFRLMLNRFVEGYIRVGNFMNIVVLRCMVEWELEVEGIFFFI